MHSKSKFIPKYQKVLRLLKEDLAENFKPDDLFYSQRELMDKFSISYATVYNVIKRLKSEGIIQAQQGKGFFVGKIPEKRRRKIRIAAFMKSEYSMLTDTVAGLLHKGIQNAQKHELCEITLFSGKDSIKELRELFSSAKCDAALFLEDSLFEHIDFAKRNNIVHAVVHPTLMKHDVCVDIADSTGIIDAVRDMTSRGRRKFLFVSYEASTHVREKVEIFKSAIELSGKDCEFNHIEMRYSADPASKLEYLSDKIRQSDADCIFVMASCIFDYLNSVIKQNAMHVPEDLDVIVFGDYDYLKRIDYPLGIIHVPLSEAVEEGAKTLIEICNSKGISQKIKLLHSQYISY
jgi:DNA-binding LacI/PurR family transcriptional regulator